uniref:Uncharacterized protein n=1 Tax=uncultured alpha proteobacterium EF100_102A06 TaxID=710799 RepID=E0Y245_9PROT|nr:hypothetical protein [uncultured alpha proteobacterium EF100_102A06]
MITRPISPSQWTSTNWKVRFHCTFPCSRFCSRYDTRTHRHDRNSVPRPVMPGLSHDGARINSDMAPILQA